MGKIIELCGAPDERSEYKDTVTQVGGTSSVQVNGSAYGSQNNFSGQSNGSYDGVSDVREKVIVTTRLTYRHIQPAVLIFKDGLLVDRVFLH